MDELKVERIGERDDKEGWGTIGPRIPISQTKANYWKVHRGEDRCYKGMHREHWKQLREGILALEEEGSWICEEDILKDDCTGAKDCDRGMDEGEGAVDRVEDVDGHETRGMHDGGMVGDGLDGYQDGYRWGPGRWWAW